MLCYESSPWGLPLSRTRALPDADFAGFPIDVGLLSNWLKGPTSKVRALSHESAEQDTRAGLFCLHDNSHPAALNHLSGANLGGLAALRLAVHRHLPFGDHMLAPSAAVGNGRQLEQIAQPDILTFQLNLDGFHNRSDDFDSTLSHLP
jgi:hypothetical protein